jgi:hypothetical protein
MTGEPFSGYSHGCQRGQTVSSARSSQGGEKGHYLTESYNKLISDSCLPSLNSRMLLRRACTAVGSQHLPPCPFSGMRSSTVSLMESVFWIFNRVSKLI